MKKRKVPYPKPNATSNYLSKHKSIEKYPDTLEEMNQQQLRYYGEYLNEAITSMEKLYCQFYLSGDTMGNKYQSWKKVRKEMDKDVSDKTIGAVYQVHQRERVQAYLDYLSFKSKVSEYHVMQRLNELISQGEDLKLSLEAIKHWHNLQGKLKTQLEVSGRIETNSDKPDWSNVSTEELEQLVSISKKLYPQEVEEAEYTEE